MNCYLHDSWAQWVLQVIAPLIFSGTRLVAEVSTVGNEGVTGLAVRVSQRPLPRLSPTAETTPPRRSH